MQTSSLKPFAHQVAEALCADANTPECELVAMCKAIAFERAEQSKELTRLRRVAGEIVQLRRPNEKDFEKKVDETIALAAREGRTLSRNDAILATHRAAVRDALDR